MTSLKNVKVNNNIFGSFNARSHNCNVIKTPIIPLFPASFSLKYTLKIHYQILPFK